MNLIVVCLTSFLLAIVSAEIVVEEGVLVLTESNFDEALSAHEHILVEFYAPWCGHCKALAPEYASAAQKLQEEGSSIKLAKVDATQESSLASKYEVQGYPTLKFFRKKVPIEYNGGRVADAIISWLKKKTGPPLTVLSTVEETEKFIEGHTVTLVGFFKDPESAILKKLEEAAGKIDEQHFGVSSAVAVHEKYKVGDEKLVLFKTFDEGKVEYDGDFSLESIKEFISKNELPLVVEFSPESSSKVFGSDIKTHLVAFMGLSASGHTDRHNVLQEVAKKFRGKIHVVYVNADIEDHLRILEFFALTKDKLPAYRVINLKSDMIKYQPDTEEFNVEKMSTFVQNSLDGKLKPLLLSQDIPADWDAKPVKVLVGKNFNSVARDRSKSVFVEFYAPWCGHCKALAPIWDELGEAYKNSQDIIIAKMDSTTNEVEGIKIASFPTIKFFPKDSDEIKDYEGDRTLDAFKAYLEKGGKVEDEDKKRDEL